MAGTGQWFFKWLPKSSYRKNIPIQRTHNRNIFLFWCEFRHYKKILVSVAGTRYTIENTVAEPLSSSSSSSSSSSRSCSSSSSSGGRCSNNGSSSSSNGRGVAVVVVGVVAVAVAVVVAEVEGEVVVVSTISEKGVSVGGECDNSVAEPSLTAMRHTSLQYQ